MADPGVIQWFKELISDPPEAKPTDPRFQYQPNQLLPSHVEAVPRFNTPEEAQDWTARKFNNLPLNFTYARPPQAQTEKDFVNIFQNIAPTLERAYQGGSTFPSSLNIDPERKGGTFEPNTATTAFFRPRDKSMHVNANFAFEYPKLSPGVVMHELGHASDPNVFRSGWYLPDTRKVAEKVSDYAASHPDEFIAETYGGTALGKKYDKDVMDTYKAYNAPSIPSLPPEPLDVQHEQMVLRFKKIADRMNALGGTVDKAR